MINDGLGAVIKGCILELPSLSCHYGPWLNIIKRIDGTNVTKKGKE
jgi:hypothetical protein